MIYVVMETPPHVNEDELLTLPPEGRGWVVVHARPRCEKKIAEYCERNRIPVYLPLRKKVHRYGARERSFWSPLFPGYAFCVVDATARTSVNQNRYVANVLDVLDQASLMDQLRQIRTALSAGDVVEVMPYLEKGKRVRVQGGAFKGLEGVVLRVKGKTRVVVNVDMIQQSVAFEIDSAYIAPL